MPVFASKTYAEWEALLSKTGIPFGVIGRAIDVVDDEQAKHAGIFAETANPEVPRTVNNPIRQAVAASTGSPVSRCLRARRVRIRGLTVLTDSLASSLISSRPFRRGHARFLRQLGSIY